MARGRHERVERRGVARRGEVAGGLDGGLDDAADGLQGGEGRALYYGKGIRQLGAPGSGGDGPAGAPRPRALLACSRWCRRGVRVRVITTRLL